jgi:hypothetical protein
MPTMDDALIDRAIAAVRAAVREFTAGEPPRQLCVLCNGTLIVEGVAEDGRYSSWKIHCPCGKSNTRLKGL